MNAMTRPTSCDWTGQPAHRPLTGMGLGHIAGKGFAPRQRQETADDTYAAAAVVWRLMRERRVHGAVVQAYWTDCCDHRHLLFHNGRDCRLATQSRAVGLAYDAALAAEPERVAQIQVGHVHLIEPVRYGRDGDVVAARWVDPDQLNRFAKTADVVRGFRRVDSLVLLFRRGTLTREHVAAGFRLRDDFEIAEGARPGSEPSEVRNSSPCTDGPGDVQLAAVARYAAATQSVGLRLSGVLVAVVLRNLTVTVWAEQRGMSLTRATGYLEAAMDRLVDHYGLGSLSDAELRHAADTAG